MGYKIKRILVGDKQVRPGWITETYTGTIDSNDGNNFYNIYKSGYKVKSIHLTASSKYESKYGNNYTSAYYKFVNMNTLTGTSSNPSIAYCTVSNEGIRQSSNTPSISKRYNTGSSTREYYRNFTNSSWFNQYGSGTIDWNFDENGGTIIFNGNSTTYTTTSNEKSLIKSLFEGTSFYFDLGTNRESITATVIVTYEPV